jgi:SAM-dependent methyltransferase
MYVLETEFPDWRNLSIHESSPSGPVMTKLASNCAQYSISFFFDSVPLGSVYEGKQCENLECLSFDNATFDLFITQDVFEHVKHPERAFREIARVLKPGGAHVFTVPWLETRKTESRVLIKEEKIQTVKDPEYHGSPFDDDGCLVITDWGHDMHEIIYKHSGLNTKIHTPIDSKLGIVGDCLEVFVSC